jgi:chaperonin GroEL
MSVVIEHQETGMAPLVTKDGVTVFRSLGFNDSVRHVFMETTRDASIRTASEAGDGTTTATILAEAFMRYTMEFTKENKHVASQRIVRSLNSIVKDGLTELESITIRPTLGTPEGRTQLEAVARVSANGEAELARAVMESFDIVGDNGNVTITEASGPSKYTVEKIEGYSVPVGYEESCGPFYQKFVNDPATQSCVLEKPTFILYYGRITDFNSIYRNLAMIANAASDQMVLGGDNGHKVNHNVILVATGFSETVLANLAAGFNGEGTLNVFPLSVPLSDVKTGQMDFLMDLAAMTGATILDTLGTPLANMEMAHLGFGPETFEATRFRSNIIGYRDQLLVFERVDEIEKQLGSLAVSIKEKNLLRERSAKLTSGIARLIVQGPSHGEIRERRDRAEDAICAVRGAINSGALPGGGGGLLHLHKVFDPANEKTKSYDSLTQLVIEKVFRPALLTPVYRLFTNAGYSSEEATEFISKMSKDQTYDLHAETFVNPYKAGLLDSAPAVSEALRNSVSVASLLGATGGVVVFARDIELERQEARDTTDFLRNASVNEANERG